MINMQVGEELAGAKTPLFNDLFCQRPALCWIVLLDGAHLLPEIAVNNWVSENQEMFELPVLLFEDPKNAGPLDLAKLVFANFHMQELILT